MSKSNPPPCKDCLVLSICKAKHHYCYKHYHHSWASFISQTVNKCSILSCYIDAGTYKVRVHKMQLLKSFYQGPIQ